MAAALASGCSHEITYMDAAPACETLLGIINYTTWKTIYIQFVKQNLDITQKYYIKISLMIDNGT